MSSKALNRITTAWDKLIGALFIFACVLAFFSMVIIVYGVVMRYLFHLQPGWTIEITSFAIPYLAFLAAAWILKKEKHVKMEFLVNWLNPRSGALLNTITYSLCAITCLVLAWYGIEAIRYLGETKQILVAILEVPEAPLVSVIPVSLFLLFIEFTRRAYGYYRSFREPPRGKVALPSTSEVA